MKRLSLLIILLSAVSCVYDYPIPAVEGAENSLVFDGSIVVGGMAKLEVSRITPTSGNASGEEVSLTDWWVENEDGTVYHMNALGTVDLTLAPFDKQYRMVARCEGKTYYSPLQSPVAAPQIDSLTFSSDFNTVYCNVSLQQDTTVSKYVALSFEEIWNFHADFEKRFDVTSKENKDGTITYSVIELDYPDYSHYWCWTRRKASADILIDMGILGGQAISYPVNKFNSTNNRNHREYHLKVTARSLSEIEYRYSHSLISQEGGLNLFTPNPGEIVGNVACQEDPSEHVYGYVSTSASTSIEESLDNRYLRFSDPGTSDFIVPSPTVELSWYIDAGYWPIKRVKRGEEIPIGWGELRCIDCILAGGTLEKPDFSE